MTLSNKEKIQSEIARIKLWVEKLTNHLTDINFDTCGSEILKSVKEIENILIDADIK